ncbi:MAG: right-handed parallel beta-helix repeat-containing protein [Thermoplasmata archaeon]
MRSPKPNIKALILAGALVLTFLLINPNRAAAGTPVQGPISTDTTWTQVGSPYWVEGDVTVLSSANLTIEPGVEVLFNGLYAMYVEGEFYAVGSPASVIDLTSNASIPSPGDWKGLQVNATGRAIIRHTNITYATDGVAFEESSENIVSRSYIAFNSESGISIKNESTSNRLDWNRIQNNSDGIYIDWSESSNSVGNNNISFNDNGVHCDCKNDIIEHNEMYGNRFHAIRLAGYGTVIHNNTIAGNSFGGTRWSSYWCFDGSVWNEEAQSAIYSALSYSVNRIVDNAIERNMGSGIAADCGARVDLKGNIIRNSEIGISTYSDYRTWTVESYVTASWNVIMENDVGVRILSDIENPGSSLFHHNDFIENTLHVHDKGGNTYSDSNSREGNFWSGFSEICEDWERNGLCSLPYFIGFDEPVGEIIEDTCPLKFPAVWRGPLGGQWPVAHANGSYSGQVGKAIAFNGSGSYDPDGTIETYYWDFGDGFFGNGPSPKYAYWLSGAFSVLLIVWDNDYMWSMCNTTATITEGHSIHHSPQTSGVFEGSPEPAPWP